MWHAWIVTLAVCAQPSPAEVPPELAGQVSALVRELDAAERARRETAEQQLLALGPAALDVLPVVDERASAELRLRIGRVRGEWERALAEASGKASTVTLTGEAMPLSEAITAIAKQTGNQLVDFRPQFGQEPRDVPLQLKFDKTPFWRACDALADQAGLTIYPYNDEPGLALVARPQPQLPRLGRGVYVGAFRMEAVGLTAHRDRRDPTQHTLQVDLEVAWEPRLRPIVVHVPLENLRALDERNQPLTLSAGREELEINVTPGAKSLDLPLHFQLPGREVSKIASLKGQLQVLLPGRVVECRFDKLVGAQRVEQRRAAVTVTLEQVRRNQQLWELRVRVAFDQPAHALESHRNWIFNNEAWIEAPDNEKIAYAGLETTSQTEREVGVAYLFSVPDGLAGHTFVYRTPSSVLNVPVPFELIDLELP